MANLTYRLAEPKDAESFAKWAAENPQIGPDERLRSLKEYNPTVLTFVAEKDGVPIAFVPLYLSAVLAFVGLNPEARAVDTVKALDGLKDYLMAFFIQYGIREMQTPFAPEDGVARWAIARGFEQTPRLRLDFNKEMVDADSEKASPVCS